ncbi:hypothetical protein LN042_01795 [Kitasatospora sp. RB6PN24]|uniref:hypothetical protein n=1 Tax=Kitasatospora humi TaxID=2893891 RepID=UPI001E5161CC|nr:hypothetical protein [Kitasatospora humi]MCC9305853.1 hypothetical protein [Kitasatospora humi]
MLAAHRDRPGLTGRNRLIRTGDDGERTEQDLVTDRQRSDAYHEHFGIALTPGQLRRLG